jgi:uncharacterized repeat protein (TIGR03803 family)
MDNRRRAHLRILLATAIVSLVASAATAQVAETILHRFALDGTEGIFPYAPLIQATDGNFYGTTSQSGAFGNGTVFQMTPDGTVFTVLHAFAGGTDGATPYAALIQATDGKFYGTTVFGGGANPNCRTGPGGCGVVFQMTPDGTVTVLHAFTAGTDGAWPHAALIQATDGNLYGTADAGGAGGGGTIFTMTPDGTVFTVLHAFAGGTEGYDPVAIIQATDRNLYGVTYYGGAGGGSGTVFTMTLDGTGFTVLHAFAGGTDGTQPQTGLIQATDGNFYGTTYYGGAGCTGTPGCGTVFRMTSEGTVTVVHAFAAGTDGGYPIAGVIQATDENLYGATQDRVFQMTPDGTGFTVLHTFAGQPDGAAVYSAILQATDGNFYGTTVRGGYFGGVVYELRASAQSGSFSLTGSLNTARYSYTATRLPNGTVLFAGGAGNGDLLASAELYDPVTGIFTPTGDLNTARYLHTATLLNNGLVLIAGGLFYSSPWNGGLASAELYNPATGIFTPTGSLNAGRYNATATLLNNGMVLIAGGFDSGAERAIAELYDPTTGIFTATGSLNTARGAHTATLLNNGRPLIAGGTDNYGTPQASAELYNPVTGTFTLTGNLNTARVFHTATLLNNGMVLIAGGNHGPGGGQPPPSLASAELYDPVTGIFTFTGNLHTTRGYDGAATLLPNGMVLIAGGASLCCVLTSAELYDPITGTFTPTGSLHTGRFYVTATLLNGGMVLIAGGAEGTAALDSAELYTQRVDGAGGTMGLKNSDE